jgi:hypothetical protein
MQSVWIVLNNSGVQSRNSLPAILGKGSLERPGDMPSPTAPGAGSERRPSGVPAFKEWAIVCDSIARGETSLIFRKGGIAEGRDGFQFKHQKFFLFPTYFHGQIERTRLNTERDLKPQRDPVAISVFIQVEFTTFIRGLTQIQDLEPLHVLQASVLEERFNYDDRQGLHLAFVRAYRISPVWEFPLEASYGGCRSWVDLAPPPSVMRMASVLSDEEQSRRRALVTTTLA